MAILEQLSRTFKEKKHNSPHIMLFAPWYCGHYPSYLWHLIRYWNQQRLLGTLSVVVMPTFLEAHERDIAALATEQEHQTSNFVPITKEEQAQLESVRSSSIKAFVQYQLIVRYALKLEATQGLLMHYDSCQIPLALGLRLPCPFSGIYYTPTLHYTQFSNYSPTWKERSQHLKERIFLSRIFAHPQFKTLFCLDPIAVKFIDRFSDSAKVVHLPDPVEKMLFAETAVGDLKLKLGIESNRRTILAFGTLADKRKGIPQFLAALRLLEPKLARKICILFVGEFFLEGQATVKSWLAQVPPSLPIQIVTQFGYVSEKEVPLYFQLSDVVIAPYQKHPGMSGILLLAAAARKPILSSNYGLMGELVEKYGLGIGVDTTNLSEIARGLTRLLSTPANLTNAEGMKTFTELNSPQKFASVIFQNT